MKKLVLLIFLILLIIFLFSYNKEDITVFSYIDSEVFDNYYIKFNDCDLNTNNFIEKLELLKNKDFKILKIIPINYLNEVYLFY